MARSAWNSGCPERCNFPVSNVHSLDPERSLTVPTLLIVEDNEMNRDMLSRRLQRRGYDILIATDGAEGLAAARERSPDLVLMDMSLPVIDGWEATRRLKSEEATRRIPIIALTAHAMSGDRQRAVDAGCDDFDTKPIELERLLEKIEQCLGQAGKS
jgi:two-component system, cell cycle response regulator DivK